MKVRSFLVFRSSAPKSVRRFSEATSREADQVRSLSGHRYPVVKIPNEFPEGQVLGANEGADLSLFSIVGSEERPAVLKGGLPRG